MPRLYDRETAGSRAAKHPERFVRTPQDIEESAPCTGTDGHGPQSDRFARILERISDGVYALDRDLRFVYANPQVERMTGKCREELIGRNVLEIFPQAANGDGYSAHLRALRENRPVSYRAQSAATGRWIEATIYPDEAGLSVYVRDIDEQLRAEQALRESEARLATELNAARRLQDISTLLIQEGDIDALYHRILDAAIDLMHSDMASMQMLDHSRGALRLLAWKGFHPDSAACWEWVTVGSHSSCGEALRTGRRVVVADVEMCDSIAGTPDLDAYRRSGIRAVQSTPLLSRSGHLLGMISTHWRDPHRPTDRDLRLMDVLARQAADLIERTHTEAALRDSQERLATALLASETGTFRWTIQDDVLEWDESLKRLFGLPPEQPIRGIADFLDFVHPADRDALCAEVDRAIRERANLIKEFRIVRPDGTVRWISDKARAFYDGDGRPLYLTGACRDVTEQKQDEQHQRLLVAELSHRVKNTLAVVQAIAGQTMRRSASLEDFANAFGGRLRALAATHGLLTESGWRSADLSRLIGKTLEAHGVGNGDVILSGPELGLAPKQALALGLVLHELATNAAKHGALSLPSGRVGITWELAHTDDGPRLRLDWAERGGPPAVAPRTEGFGMKLIRHTASYELEGAAELHYGSEGLRCAITIPWRGGEAAPITPALA